MPHEILMPALGMSQDSGLIVSWLKNPGDSVAIGDALMEVETDKAMVEVEAQAEGFLTQVRAAAGEHVPVGEIIGIIAESADANVSDTTTNTGKPKNQAKVTASSASQTSFDTPSETFIASADTDNAQHLPEGYEFVMPALGMAQESGVIVNWHKAPGDAIAADDSLLDVETDKSIMEVPAGRDGYIAAILAEVDDEVPVGSVVAIISTVKPEHPVSRGYTAASPTETSPPTPASAAEQAPAKTGKTPARTTIEKPEATPGDVLQTTAGSERRILASPKARRLALLQGLDLKQLAELGVEQPYHVADLETLRQATDHLSKQKQHQSQPNALNATRSIDPQRQTEQSPPSNLIRITAVTSTCHCDDFLDWVAGEAKTPVTLSELSLRFATAALRQVYEQTEDTLCVEVRSVRQTAKRYTDADHYRLSQTAPELNTEKTDQTPGLILRDMTDSPITSISITDSHTDTLTLGRQHDQFEVTLDYRLDRLDEQQAIQFITDFTERLHDPLLHLL